MQVFSKCSQCENVFEHIVKDHPLKYSVGGTDEPICYNCALARITGGKPPEEGDFNAALIISGQMTEQEAKWLQEDLRAAETGRSLPEPYWNEDEEPFELVEYNDGDEENECVGCGYQLTNGKCRSGFCN